jgi:hypothetical protein
LGQDHKVVVDDSKWLSMVGEIPPCRRRAARMGHTRSWRFDELPHFTAPVAAGW